MRQIYSIPSSNYNKVQKFSFYSASSGFIASSDDVVDWVGFTSDSGRTIIKRFITNVNYNNYNVNLTFGFGIKGVKAFNQDTIVVYGDYGFVPAILYSTNGGLSYLLVYHSQFNAFQLSGGITDMVFPENNNIGYATDADRILKTTNKGQSWSVVRTDPDSFFDFLDGIDNNNVFAYSTAYNASKILKTANAGSGWQIMITPPANIIYHLDFITANKGWLNLASNNTDSLRLYYTSNGGSSWTQKNHCEATPFYCYQMEFVNDSTGYGIGNYFDTYKTTDSGKVWQPLPRDNNYSYLGYSHNEIQCLNETQLWCGAIQDFIEISTNGGGTPIPTSFFRVDTLGSFPGNIVKLINYSKPNYQFKWFVNNVQVSTNYHTTYTHNVLSPVDSIELVVISGAMTDTLKRYQYFSIPNLPAITSFSPTTGSTGTFVTINGSGFTAATSVKFGGVNAASFNVVSSTMITAIVAAGATGAVSVANVSGSYSLPGFTYFPVSSSPPPVVFGFTPASGLPGVLVTITGNNFGPAVNDNIVYFGAVKANITSASATQIVCTAPVGGSFEALSVLNTTNNLSGQSLKPFAITFHDSSNFTRNSYKEALTFSYNSSTKHVFGKDLDGDGKPDLINVLGTFNGDSIIVYRNTTDGTNFSFAPKKNLGIVSPFASGYFDVKEIDGDGKPDIVSSTNGTDVTVLRNTSTPGNISFANQLSVPALSGGNQDVVIADLDNDGKNDIASGNFSSKNVTVIRNTSSPGYLSFGAPLNFATQNNPVRIAAGDIDGDGKIDVISYNYVVSGGNPTDFSCFRNTTAGGTISFATRIDVSVPGSAVQSRTLNIADYDNDNKLDVIIVNDNSCNIFRNTSTAGNISFAPVITIPLAWGGQGSWISNVSGDMKPDIIVGNSGERYFSLIRNLSTPGTIANNNAVNIEGTVNQSIPYYTNAADFNMDGKIDIIVSSAQDKVLTIFSNKMGSTLLFGPNAGVCAGGITSWPSDVTGTTYQWQQNTGSGFVDITNNSTFSGAQSLTLMISNVQLAWHGYLYRCIVDGNLYSSHFVLQVNTNAAPSLSISTPATSICYGVSATFTANGVNTGPLTGYSWQVNGINVPGNNTSTFTSNTLTNGAQVKAFLFNACSTPNNATSNTITMNVTGDPSSVSISTPSTTACVNSSVTFTATPAGPGASPSYQWQVNGVNAGTNSTIFTTSSLANGDQVKVIMTTVPTACGTNPPVTSNIITMNITNPATPTVTILSTATSICQGEGVNFNVAASTNPGSSPSYQWQVNGVNVGLNLAIYSSSSFNNGDQVKVIMTSSASCITTNTATSNIITLTVNSAVTPTITISGTTTVILGQSSIIGASITNGGTPPAFQWQDSTFTHSWAVIPGATLQTINYQPAQTGVKLRCILTSNGGCPSPVSITSSPLVFTVNFVTAVDPVPGSNYGIAYFPNPVTNILYIDSLRLSDKWQTLEVTGIDGRPVLSIKNIVNRTMVFVNVIHLPAGMYIAVLRRNNGAAAYLKFIKL